MFYPECDQCAKNNSDLENVITKIDTELEKLPLSSVIRPDIFAQKLSEKVSKITGVFEILCDEGLILKKTYLLCSNPACENLIEVNQYKRTIEDGDNYECSQCGTDLTKKRLKESTIFRFNPEKYRLKKSQVSSHYWSQDFPENEVISILFLCADPTDADRLRLGQEFREIQEKLIIAKQRDRFKLESPQFSTRPEDLSLAMLNSQPHIIHFSGHGADDGSLCFENKFGKVHLINPDAMAELFKQFTPRLICVVLNACFSEKQATAIAAHVKYVVGMKSEIGDEAAIAYTVGFYQALGAGRSIEKAHQFGCTQIRLQGIDEYLTPTLFKS